ncbi:hypothetical protein I7I48_09916 [Histoplasma ohiense]|nr:hypothetical protein I7I48_09916 [Histoplasma ohiense (nom. inval.)]
MKIGPTLETANLEDELPKWRTEHGESLRFNLPFWGLQINLALNTEIPGLCTGSPTCFSSCLYSFYMRKSNFKTLLWRTLKHPGSFSFFRITLLD